MLFSFGLRGRHAGAARPARRAPVRERRTLVAIAAGGAGTGGPEAYTGKDMVATHKGMNINEQEFMSVIDDAMDALQKNDIDEATRNEVLAVLWSMRREVLRV